MNVNINDAYGYDTRLTEDQQVALKMMDDKQKRYELYNKFISAWYGKISQELTVAAHGTLEDMWGVTLVLLPIFVFFMHACFDSYALLIIGGLLELTAIVGYFVEMTRSALYKSFEKIISQCAENAELTIPNYIYEK